ncbi:MAG TPA: DUF72 domain-containing protein [bacterium]|nr:DUF72 domain-containing protein [bacterium]
MAAQTSLLPAASPAPIDGRIYVGTCSWAEKSFVKADFYPPGVRSASDRLRYYAGRFSTVEVDASYFTLLPSAYSRRWAEETPPGFVMNAKAFGLFTGHRVAVKRLPPGFANLLPAAARDSSEVKLADTPEEFRNACWDAYREFLAPLAAAGKLGYVLFQLPPGARYTPAAIDEMARWTQELAGRRIAVEFRHRSWSRHPEIFDELARLKLAYVIVDLPDLPWLMPAVEAVTSDIAVLRFHGRNREGWARAGASTDQRYAYDYSAEELRRWAGAARRLSERTDKLYAMFNNHVGGAMARDAQTLAALLEGGG